jgi:hypothetical protein
VEVSDWPAPQPYFSIDINIYKINIADIDIASGKQHVLWVSHRIVIGRVQTYGPVKRCAMHMHARRAYKIAR